MRVMKGKSRKQQNVMSIPQIVPPSITGGMGKPAQKMLFILQIPSSSALGLNTPHLLVSNMPVPPALLVRFVEEQVF